MAKKRLNQKNIEEDKMIKEYFVKDVLKTIFVSFLIFIFQAVLFFLWMK